MSLQQYIIWTCCLLSLSACRTPSSTSDTLKAANPRISPSFVTAERWREHYVNDLLPFWLHPDAMGNPVGNFPTFRCNDGSGYKLSKPCPELAHSDSWITSELGRNYFRMQSRQIFFYGVGFHLTGDLRLLKLAKAGVEFLQKNALRPDGSLVTYLQDGKPDMLGARTTSQDAAYALMGLGFYYYLTRDAAVLRDILSIKNRIFATYFVQDFFGKGQGLVRWNGQETSPLAQDLTANLDQLNAYMVLLTPLLPEPEKAQWNLEMKQIVQVLRTQFYSKRDKLFLGQLHSKATALPGWGHMDYGHTAKTFWMMNIIAKQTRDAELEQFARNGILSTIKSAYLGKDQSGRSLGYASRPHLWDGMPPRSNAKPINCPTTVKANVNCEQEWWVFAELEQAGMTVALTVPDVGLITDETNQYWLDQMVDHEGKEIWHMLSSPYGKPKFPKAHLWKNGFHTAEHALIGFLTAHWRLGESAPLFFSWTKTPERQAMTAYFYPASVASIENKANAVQLVRFVKR